MQFTTIVALSFAAIGAFAAPEAEAEAGRGYNRPSYTNNNNYYSGNKNHNQENYQGIQCGSNSGTYCCSAEYGSKGGINAYDCYSFTGTCNAITVCCANNAQGKSGAGQQCSGLGSVFVRYH
ncbi:hypothetical protein B0I35DRAFT_484821 [Stachybotrys elegans]|uniref:Hydrophobin n=1 Tax=Stachybotrys elegans TaxID=80388 RepID=A0A8K0SI41_9HYPO|nr:hypothetical protein B0I35DRAFT_484821 [Stachybotrys elegans]